MINLKCAKCGKEIIFKDLESAFNLGWAVEIVNEEYFCKECYKDVV